MAELANFRHDLKHQTQIIYNNHVPQCSTIYTTKNYTKALARLRPEPNPKAQGKPLAHLSLG